MSWYRIDFAGRSGFSCRELLSLLADSGMGRQGISFVVPALAGFTPCEFRLKAVLQTWKLRCGFVRKEGIPTTLVAALILFGCTHLARAESIEQQQTSGPVSISLSLDPKTPVIGDTVTLSIQVVAEKDVEVLMPDFGSALDRFSIVDFAPRETIDEQGRTVARQTYRLDPPSSGRHVIPPILIEYVDRREGEREAPEGLDAYEVLTDRIPFEVASVLPDTASDDLKPPLGELAPITKTTTTHWAWLVVPGLVVLVLIPLMVRSVAAARRRGRRRSAYDVAKSRLRKLLTAPRQGDASIDQFYVGLSYIIRQYIEDRFEMRAPELTTEEFLSSMSQSPDFTAAHQGLLREFLKQADLVKFARAHPTSEDTDRAIEEAEKFLEETREDAPLLDADDTSHGSEALSEQLEEAVHG